MIRSVDPVDWVPRPAPVAHINDAYCMLISGDSMFPEFRPGDSAIVNPRLPIVGGEVLENATQLHAIQLVSEQHPLPGARVGEDRRERLVQLVGEGARELAEQRDTSEMGDTWTEICAYGTAVRVTRTG